MNKTTVLWVFLLIDLSLTEVAQVDDSSQHPTAGQSTEVAPKLQSK